MILELVLFDNNNIGNIIVIEHRHNKIIHLLFHDEYIISEALVKLFMDEHLVKFFKDQAVFKVNLITEAATSPLKHI